MRTTSRRAISLLFGFVAAFAAHAAPGTATLSSFTMSPGGSLDFEVNSALATPGSGADFLSISGVLAVNAGTTPSSVFTISIISLNNVNGNVALSDFDATRTYSYTLATAAGGITGFSAAEIAIDVSGFKNSLQGGSFGILQSTDGKSLILQFKPVLLRPFQITNLVLDTTSLPGSNRVTLTWNSVIGQIYRIQKSATLESAVWIDDSAEITATAISTVGTSNYTTPKPGREFWRVSEAPPHPFASP